MSILPVAEMAPFRCPSRSLTSQSFISHEPLQCKPGSTPQFNSTSASARPPIIPQACGQTGSSNLNTETSSSFATTLWKPRFSTFREICPAGFLRRLMVPRLMVPFRSPRMGSHNPFSSAPKSIEPFITISTETPGTSATRGGGEKSLNSNSPLKCALFLVDKRNSDCRTCKLPAIASYPGNPFCIACAIKAVPKCRDFKLSRNSPSFRLVGELYSAITLSPRVNMPSLVVKSKLAPDPS